MKGLILDAVGGLGEIGVALLMLLENVFPPIPSELIMPLAGYLSSQDRLSFPGAITAGTIGSFAGAVLWYVLGRRLGRDGLRRWVERRGHWVGLAPEDVDRSSDWFRRHGTLAVLLGRLIPGVRSFISLPAGVGQMPVAPFLALTFLGSAIWVAALAFIGRLLGQNFEHVDRYLGPVSWVVFGALLALYLRRIWRHRRRR
jgi:membrane protein DedA with SNARE-associated domain